MSQRRKKAQARRNKIKEISGSQPLREPDFIQVGFLHKAHGLKGEMVMSVVTEFPERLVPGKLVYVGEDVYDE